MISLEIAFLLLLACVVSYFTTRRLDRFERSIACAMPVMASLVAWLVAQSMVRVASSGWDAVRLTFAFSAARGFPVYVPHEVTAAIQPSIYGPGLAYAYFPATIIPSPTAAMEAGLLLTWVLVFCPVAALLRRASTSRTLGGFLACVAVFLCWVHPSLRYSTTFIHADAPALGFTTLALICFPRRPRRARVRVAFACLFAACAVWSKQTFLPVFGALASLALLRGGRQSFVWCASCSIAAFLAILGLMLVKYDLTTLRFNLITVPGRHPWIDAFHDPPWHGTFTRPNLPLGEPLEGSKTRILIDSARNLIESGLFHFAGGVLAVAWRFTSAPIRRRGWAALRGRTSMACLIMTMFLVPASILGPVKIGGAENTLTPAIFFAMLTMLSGLGEWAAVGAPTRPASRNARAAIVAFGAWGVLNFLPQRTDLEHIGIALERLDDNFLQVSYNYEKANPGRAWFADCALPALLASNKMYHTTQGIHERWIAGFGPSEEEFRAHVPPNFEYLVLTQEDWIAAKVEPEFRERVNVPELPGLIVYRRGGAP